MGMTLFMDLTHGFCCVLLWNSGVLINGKDIIRLLELRKGGPVVSEWQRKLLQWQLAYPSGSVERVNASYCTWATHKMISFTSSAWWKA
ncbi:hypothetical protein Tco_0936743 [Tanacetum coccineum]|uniref:Uncharacterized protein n=1 Tax=Tanacetum coccineum TaxID=301880 RepID=A0ABQ5DD44_9ASTR